jgi:ABC-2 type transport system permease protein
VIAQARAELLKLRSTRTALGLALAMVLLALLFLLLTGLLSGPEHLTTAEDQRGLFGAASIAGIFSALAGVLLVTGEYRFGTIRPTFLFTPRRSRVLAAKLAAGLLGGLALGVAAEALALAVGGTILAARGIPFALSHGELALLVLGTFAGVALWGGIGVGIGLIVRSQVGAVIGLLAWGFVADNLLFAFVPSVGRFTPTRAQDGLMGLTVDHLLSPAAGGAVLVAWTAALALAGVGSTARRDVT